MAETEILARDYTFELNTGTEASPTWVEVEGLNTWAHAPASGEADTTTFDDDGDMTHLKASRGHTFTLSGLLQEDEGDGSRAAGQEAVESWALLKGTASLKQFRITSPGGNVRTFNASAEVTKGGGGNDDPDAWSVAVHVSGPITDS